MRTQTFSARVRSNKMEKQTKQEQDYNNLKLLCYEGKANAESFEYYIKKQGLDMLVIILIASYYKDDYDLIVFP